MAKQTTLRKSVTALGRRRYGETLVAILFASALAVLLVVGIRASSRLQADAAALKIASEQLARPDYLGAQVSLIQRAAESRAYLGDSIAHLRGAMTGFDTDLAALTLAVRASAPEEPGLAVAMQRVATEWGSYRRLIQPIAEFKGTAYRDTETGSTLTPEGEALTRQLSTAIESQDRSAAELRSALDTSTVELQRIMADRAASLRNVQVLGAIIALVLLVSGLYFALRAKKESAALQRSEEQTSHILSTVKDGLFLLDRELRIGSVVSRSLPEILRMENVAGSTFEDMLRPLVSEKTLGTALKFVRVLWKQHVNEELIESVNPLGQVEVRFDAGGGRAELRYLEFTFKRVRSDAQQDLLLGSINDITDRVRLARELEQSREQAQSQMDMVMQVVNVDRGQLMSFVRDSDTALRKTNAILKVPARDEAAFRSKLNGFFREVHGVKGEASALGLASVANRAHTLESDLSLLRDKEALDGTDFLPLVIKLEELMAHIGLIGDLGSRLATPSPADSMDEPDPLSETQTITSRFVSNAVAAAEDASLSRLLESLATDVAKAQGKRVRIAAQGMDQVPMQYRKAVKDAAVQMVRNSIVHGIESPEERRKLAKPEVGSLQIELTQAQDGSYTVVFQDDGRGLSYERILEVALRRGILETAQAAAMQRGDILSLIFRSGFSTAESVSQDAGRGVGLDVVAAAVRGLGGQVGVASGAGKFTRFKLMLPPTSAATAAVA